RPLLLRLAQQALRFLQRIGGPAGRRAAVVVAVGGGLARRGGRLVQAPRGVRQVLSLLTLPLLFTTELLELTGLLFELICEGAEVTATRARLPATASLL